MSPARPVDLSPSTALRASAGPRVAWAPAAGQVVVGCDVAEEVTTAGPGRFERLRTRALALFSALELSGASGVDAPVRPAARPRLFGGFAFHGDHEPAPPWRGFPSAPFVLPRIQVAATGTTTRVTTSTTGPDADAESSFAVG